MFEKDRIWTKLLLEVGKVGYLSTCDSYWKYQPKMEQTYILPIFHCMIQNFSFILLLRKIKTTEILQLYCS